MRVEIRDLGERIKQTGSRFFERADRWSGGIFGILKDTIRQFIAARGPEAAASMAYYAIFSLFPLLLGMISIGSYFMVESEQLKLQIFHIIQVIIPVSADLIVDNIDQVLDKRGAIGAVGVIGLLWSASGAFTTLFHNINRAWTKASPLNSLKSRLFAVGIILVSVILLVVALFANAILDLLPAIDFLFIQGETLFKSPLWVIISSAVPPLITFLIFLGLFWLIPNTSVKWREAFWAALIAAVSWELTTLIFTWYLRSDLAAYEIVYGTLGTMIALLFWIYLNSLIVIFCAHLSAMIANHTRKRTGESSNDGNAASI